MPVSRITSIGVTAFCLLLSGSVSVVADELRPCTYGDARSLFESLPNANQILLRSGVENPRADDSVRCHWRLFWVRGHPLFGDIIFSEDDVLLGGVNILIPYEAEGLTRTQAVTELEGIRVRTWLARVEDGVVAPLVEQHLMTTTVKDSVAHPSGQRRAVVAWGFITQLPPGEYRSVTQLRHVDGDDTGWHADWTVRFTVTPSGPTP